MCSSVIGEHTPREKTLQQMMGMLVLGWLLLSVGQAGAPPPPTGSDTSSCDLTTLPTRIESAEHECCPTAGCVLTSSSVCSLGCAQVVTPLMQSCSAELKLAGAASLFQVIGPACEKALIAADPASGAVGTNCEYADFLPVTMACASYLQLSSEALDADSSFCYSACFEQVSVFHTRCASKMTSMMWYALGAVGTEVEKPVSRCASGSSYDGTDTLICEATGAAAVFSRLSHPYPTAGPSRELLASNPSQQTLPAPSRLSLSPSAEIRIGGQVTRL